MDDFTGKTLLILGLARQGIALARFAAEAGAHVIVSDMRTLPQLESSMQQLADLEIDYVLGEHPMNLLEKADVVAISGGVPADAPLVHGAQARNIPVTNDSQEFVRRVPTDVIGITGSAGKTTTTALTGVMGQIAGRRTWVGGNIGRPLIADLHKMQPDDMVVQELSSFQLEIWKQSPHVAAVLNITPNHLDRHKTMAAYANAKANILRYQTVNDVAVLCADDPGAYALSPLVQGRLRLFSLVNEVNDGAFVRAGHVWIRSEHEEMVLPVHDIPLRGQHNVLNVLAAVTLADTVGIPVAAMRKAIQTFTGVEHRLEQVSVLNGVKYINDSIATAPERVLAALASFQEPVVLLAGGKDKDMVWDEWTRQVAAQVKHVVLFGALAEMLAGRLAAVGYTHVTRVETLTEAVRAAWETAVVGDIVLLSPGGTSFDAFTDFAARGEAFRGLVKALYRRK